jgi:hypothetical protein
MVSMFVIVNIQEIFHSEFKSVFLSYHTRQRVNLDFACLHVVSHSAKELPQEKLHIL